jgi:hypothetical protein
MQLLISITIGVLCILFVYFAFKHVSDHEKADNKRISKLTKMKKKK